VENVRYEGAREGVDLGYLVEGHWERDTEMEGRNGGSENRSLAREEENGDGVMEPPEKERIERNGDGK
jgi:hypothetical protein